MKPGLSTPAAWHPGSQTFTRALTPEKINRAPLSGVVRREHNEPLLTKLEFTFMPCVFTSFPARFPLWHVGGIWSSCTDRGSHPNVSTSKMRSTARTVPPCSRCDAFGADHQVQVQHRAAGAQTEQDGCVCQPRARHQLAFGTQPAGMAQHPPGGKMLHNLG